MILTVSGLHKQFGGFQALKGVDLDLEQGEVVGFLGANGAGKSTTMKIIAGYLTPSSGSVHIAGMDQQAAPLACRGKIGYLPQDLPLYRDMKVRQYLDHVARLKGIAAKRRRNEIVRVIERAHLDEVENRHISKLSGGNRQRVGLAQALIGSPPILIMDEATAGLDPAQVANFRDLVTELAKDHGILFSTHILAEVEACCDRVVVIHRGRNILADSIEGLQARTAGSSSLRIRLGDASRLGDCQVALNALDWVASCERDGDQLRCLLNEDRRAELISCCQDHGGLRELGEERQSLEEVFRDLIRSGDAA